MKEIDSIEKTLKAEIKGLKSSVKELSSESEAGRKSESADKSKFEKLNERDQIMSKFLETFPQAKAGVDADVAEAQKTIVSMLAHIAEGVQTSASMPTEERFAEMQQERTFKERQLVAGQDTLEKLKSDHAAKVSEIDAIRDLDVKISKEMGSLASEMEAFEDTDALRHQAGRTVSFLQSQLELYSKRRDDARSQVTTMSAQHDSIKKDISAGPAKATARGLEKLEKKIQLQATTVFSLSEYVAIRESETDFESLKNSAMDFVTDINKIVKQKAADGEYSTPSQQWAPY